MTWLMDGAKPAAVTAMTQRLKPQTYGRVDDDANILVEYPHAIGIIEGSWDWPFARKDLEVYAATGYAIATGGDSLRTRLPGQKEAASQPESMPTEDRDSVAYLVSVVRDHRKVEGLSSLENNMVVVAILDAARESAKTGKRILLH